MNELRSALKGTGCGPAQFRRVWRLAAMGALAMGVGLGLPVSPVAAQDDEAQSICDVPGMPPNMLSFPGAEGFGRFAAGGRGGVVLQVTNLDDSGPGSLRSCIEADMPRVCVFRVGGVIRFTSEPPIIRNPCLTIAGQTAPGSGILLTHDGGAEGFTPLVVKNTHDVVVRHIRVRTDKEGKDHDSNDAFTIEDSQSVILDHVSGSWAYDENVNTWGDTDNITISWSVFAEGIPRHDKCALLAGGREQAQNLSFLRNVCAHSGDRNPEVDATPDSCVEVINNVLYNGQSEFMEIWETYGGTPVNVIGNYFKAGNDTSDHAAGMIRQTRGSKGFARIFTDDNYFDSFIETPEAFIDEARSHKPVCPLMSSVLPVQEAYEIVLRQAGALPHDAFDKRIARQVREGTGSIVREPGVLPPMHSAEPYVDKDGDGMADDWEEANGADPAVYDPWDDADEDGWPNLDEFLDSLHVSLIEGTAAQ